MTRDAAATRTRLLAAAREEFAQQGIDGARVDRIARKAGVNKERIYGHFGSKEKLFEAVIIDVLEEHVSALGLPSGDLAEYVGRIYDSHRKRPHLLRLLMWEALHYGDKPVPNEERRIQLYAEKVHSLAATLQVPADNKAAVTLLSLIALGAWPVAVPQLTRLITGHTTDTEVRQHLTELARKTVS